MYDILIPLAKFKWLQNFLVRTSKIKFDRKWLDSTGILFSDKILDGQTDISKFVNILFFQPVAR
jgi:hypothetical protein